MPVRAHAHPMNARRTSLNALALLAAMTGCGGSIGDPGAPPGPSQPPLNVPPPSATTSPPPSWEHLDLEGEVQALTTSPGRVCWSSYEPKALTSVVACASNADGRRTELVRDALVHPAIAASAEHVYWSTEMTAMIERAPLAGGAVTPVVTKSGPHGRFVLQKDSVYWLVDGGAGSVLFSASANGDGSPAKVANLGPGDADLLSVVDDTVYAFPLVFSFGADVQRTRAQEGAPKETLAGSCFYATDLEADAQHVFWSCQDRTLHWMAAGAEHVERDVGYGKIAIHRGLAYVTDTSRGVVRRVRASDGAVDVIQTGIDRAYHIAVDDSGIYVGSGKSIRRFPL
jgi:hypothetical protein